MPYIILCGCALAALLILRVAVGMPESSPRLEVAHSQTIGRRQINADVFAWSARGGRTVLALADGIGAGTRGRAAALAATDAAARTADLKTLLANPAYFFRHAFHSANEAVLTCVPDGTAGANMLCVLVSGDMLYYALAGNCKLAVFRKKRLIPASEGQTLDALARSAFQNGEISREDALNAVRESRVYNFVGKNDFRDPEMPERPIRLKRGDQIVLMTDGVYEYLPQLDLERILNRRWGCRRKAEAVTGELDRRGDPEQDNATVVIAKVNR